jgi:recombination protein RecA
MDILKKIVGQLKNKYTTLNIASEIEDPSDFISTGNIAFDLALDGGIPFGYMTEFLGLSQSGKSMLIHSLIANAQRDYNAIGILFDRENAFTRKRGEQLGIQSDRLVLVRPADMPTVVDAFISMFEIIKTIRKEEPDTYIVLGLDSIAAFGKDTSLEKSDQGRKAKSVHEGLRESLSYIDSKIAFILANQTTYKIGVMYGDPKTSTSGEALKYYSTVRIALEEVRKMKDSSTGEVIGTWIGAEVIKTRLGPAYRYVVVPHLYESGVPEYGGYVRLLVDRGWLSPKNKTEFNKFEQHTVVFNDGKTKENYSEFSVDKLFEKHPELKFESYPPFNKAKIKEEDDASE